MKVTPSTTILRVLGTKQGKRDSRQWKIVDATGCVRYIKESSAKTYINRMAQAGLKEPEFLIKSVGTSLFFGGKVFRYCTFAGFPKAELVPLENLPAKYHYNKYGIKITRPTQKSLPQQVK